MRNDRISSFFFLKKKGERWFLIWVWVIFLETFVSFYWNAESWTVFGSKENQFRTEHPPYGITLICSFGKCPFGKQQSGTNRINLFHHPLYSFFFFRVTNFTTLRDCFLSNLLLFRISYHQKSVIGKAKYSIFSIYNSVIKINHTPML